MTECWRDYWKLNSLWLHGRHKQFFFVASRLSLDVSFSQSHNLAFLLVSCIFSPTPIHPALLPTLTQPGATILRSFQQTTLQGSPQKSGGKKSFEGLRCACSGPLSDSASRCEVKEPRPHKFKYSSYFQTPTLLYPRSHFALMDGCQPGAVHFFRGVGLAAARGN